MIKLRHQGMTLLEILIAAGLFAAFMTAVAFFFARSSQLFSTGEKSTFNVRMENLALNMLTSDLRGYESTVSSPNNQSLISSSSITLIPQGPAILFSTQNNPSAAIIYFINGQDHLVRGTVNIGPSQSFALSQLSGKVTNIFAYAVNGLEFNTKPVHSGAFSLVTIVINSNSSLGSQNNPLETSLLLPTGVMNIGTTPIPPPPLVPALSNSTNFSSQSTPPPSSAAPAAQMRMQKAAIRIPPVVPSLPSNPTIGSPIHLTPTLPSPPSSTSSPSAPPSSGSGGGGGLMHTE
jgi:type II secretory pathway pseudopilin PulG